MQPDRLWRAYAGHGLDPESDDKTVCSALARLSEASVFDLARELDVPADGTAETLRAKLAALATERRTLLRRIADGTASVDEYRQMLRGQA